MMLTSQQPRSSVGRSESNLVSASDATFAESGGYRWVVLAGIFISSMIGVVDRIAWGNVSTFYAREIGVPVAALGSFFSAFYVGYLITNGISGFGADLFGGRRMLTLSLVLLGVVTYSFGLTSSIIVGLTIQCAMGLVAGMDFSACIRLLSDVFPPEKKATAMGIFLASIQVGVAIPNLFIPTLIKTSGWQGVYHVLGISTVVIGIIIYFLLGRRSDIHAKRIGSTPKAFSVLIRNPAFRAAALAGFGQQWGLWGFAFWANVLLIKGHHIDPVHAGLVVALFGGVGIVAKPGSGWIADRARIPKPVFGAIACLFFAASLFIFAQVTSPAVFAICSAFVGIFAAASGVMVVTLSVETAGAQLAGAASGLANALWVVGNFVVPLLVGIVFQYFRSFQLAVLVLAAGPLCSIFCFIHLHRLSRSSASRRRSDERYNNVS